jgi:hypothetical protein
MSASLRDLNRRVDAVVPPEFDIADIVVRGNRRMRHRRAGLAAGAAALVAAASVIAGVGGLSQRSDPAPQPVDTPTPTSSATSTPTPTSEPSPAHVSGTVMTPREVVGAANAELLYAGVSADDPDFMISAWTAECTWCPVDPRLERRPSFDGMAITVDGFKSATYVRPPRGFGVIRVLSPAPGVLLITDPANGHEVLVGQDGTMTRVQRVVADRPATEPRQWFECLSGEDQLTWCALDVAATTAYEWGTPWSGSSDLTQSAVDPGLAAPARGRRLRPNLGSDLAAWWIQDGVRRERVIAPGRRNLVADVVLGAREGLLYWSHVRGTDRMIFHVGADDGTSWRDVERLAPTADIGTEEVLATPSGAILLRHITEQGDAVRAHIWRLDSLEDGNWELVHDTGELPYMYDLGQMFQPTRVGSRLVLGLLYSDDDGQSWTQMPKLR